MKCPKCNLELEKDLYFGIKIDRCPKCRGMWFSFKELDQLEDLVFPNDESKGTLVWDKNISNLNCPICHQLMVKFNYRLISLDLDYCQKMHGYWLDQGEADRVLQIMAKNNQDLDQKLLAENEWAQHLEQLRHPSFFSRLIDSLKQAISK